MRHHIDTSFFKCMKYNVLLHGKTCTKDNFKILIINTKRKKKIMKKKNNKKLRM